jgi:hypothetical protein
MRKISRNIVKGYPLSQLLPIAKANAEKYNENWYILGNSGMTANDKGRKGWGQYEAMGITPEGEWFRVEK